MEDKQSPANWTSAEADPQLVSTRARNGVDARLAELIAQGGGITTVTAIGGSGIRRHSIRHRLDSGELVEVFDGVYAFPQDALQPVTERRAAVLSCGPGARLHHWSCAQHWDLVTFQTPPDNTIHIAVPPSRRPRRTGITVHRVALDPRDLTTHRGVPCTTVARVILDLAATADRRSIERLVDEAAYLRRWSKGEAQALVARSVGHKGVGVLREVVELHTPGTTRTANAMEEAFLAICDSQRWPRPVCQVPDTLTGGRSIRHDFVWRGLRLIVETDGGRGHAGSYRQARDRERDKELRARGWFVIRLRWDDVLYRPRVVVAAVAPVIEALMDVS